MVVSLSSWHTQRLWKSTFALLCVDYQRTGPLTQSRPHSTPTLSYGTWKQPVKHNTQGWIIPCDGLFQELKQVLSVIFLLDFFHFFQDLHYNVSYKDLHLCSKIFTTMSAIKIRVCVARSSPVLVIQICTRFKIITTMQAIKICFHVPRSSPKCQF